MPTVALTLAVLWFVLLFVVRSLLQWRNTGSTGWKGMSGAPGSLEWNAGLLAGLGMIAAVAAPVATLLGWPGGGLFFESTGVHVGGAIAAAIGIFGALVAQVQMGSSWRIGVDAGERTTLVTHGIFGWMRNPIFTFILLSMAGLLLVVPSVLSLAAAVLSFTGIEIQVRAVEEPYLRATHGEAYETYCSNTGRFLPGLGRNLSPQSSYRIDHSFGPKT